MSPQPSTTGGVQLPADHVLDATAVDLLERWRISSRKANVAHLRATDRFSIRSSRVTVVTAALATIAGSTMFATLSKSNLNGLRITAGVIAVLSALVSTLSNQLRYGARSEAHRQAARRYGEAVREIQLMIKLLTNGATLPAAHLCRMLDSTDEAAPNVPPDIWDWAVAAVDHETVADGHPDASTYDRHTNPLARLAAD
jgi:hypothetical protein